MGGRDRAMVCCTPPSRRESCRQHPQAGQGPGSRGFWGRQRPEQARVDAAPGGYFYPVSPSPLATGISYAMPMGLDPGPARGSPVRSRNQSAAA